jgi:hypothetical protein
VSAVIELMYVVKLNTAYPRTSYQYSKKMVDASRTASTITGVFQLSQSQLVVIMKGPKIKPAIQSKPIHCIFNSSF